MLLHRDDLFGILTIEILHPLMKQPLVGSANVLRGYAIAEPGTELVVGGITDKSILKLLASNLPSLHDASVHRAWIDVVVNRSG
jgi:hypothetical protein